MHTRRHHLLAILLSLASLAAGAQTGAVHGGPALLRSRTGWGLTPGWDLMSEAERQDFRRRMDAARTPGDCARLVAQQRARMAQRARKENMPAPRDTSSAACEGMQP